MLCISQLYHVIVEANHLCGYPLTLNNLFPAAFHSVVLVFLDAVNRFGVMRW